LVVMAVVWLLLGVGLLLVELRHLAFYALFAAAGCFGAAIVALVVPSAIPVQVGAAVVVAAAGVIAVRPAMSRAFPRHVGGRVARGVHGGLVGQEALTLDEVGSPHERGHVRLSGERWLAVSGPGEPIPAGIPVVVTAVEGTTLTVWPADGASAIGRDPGPLPGLTESTQGGEVSPPPDDTPPGGAEGRSA
jgi:membrane protein implicated in regulation of membrane protease activity